MAWLIEKEPEQSVLADEFRKFVSSGSTVKIPDTHDGMSARIAKQFEFKAIYLSGAAYTASRGLPDLGIIYSNEVAEHASELIRASGLPFFAEISKLGTQ